LILEKVYNKKITNMKNFYIVLILLSIPLQSWAQTDEKAGRFSLKEAIDYAVSNNISVKNSDIDQRAALARKGEARAAGLPQINANADLIHNINIQKTVSEYGVSKLFPVDATHPAGTPAGFAFGLNNQSAPNISGTQVLFDQSFFSGMKAASVYEELTTKNMMRSKIETAHNVTKAYYGVLVNEKQLSYIDGNLTRLDSSFAEAKAKLQSGLARQIEVDRIEVSYNNLKEERGRILRIVQLGKALLKFQMNLPIDTTIVLTDDLDENILNSTLQISGKTKINYSNRIEYSIIQTQALLNKIDTRTAQASRYPRISAIGAYGFTTGATNMSNIFTQGDRWFNYSYIGLRFQVPVFNGLASYYRIQLKKLEEERTRNNKTQLEHNIDIQIEESIINLNNSMLSLKNQKRNMDLAEKNLKVLKAEFEQGISMSLDVTIAEAALNDAQTNYYNALYNALLAKADYERATGTLYQ
jgi:outer membrane protein